MSFVPTYTTDNGVGMLDATNNELGFFPSTGLAFKNAASTNTASLGISGFGFAGYGLSTTYDWASFSNLLHNTSSVVSNFVEPNTLAINNKLSVQDSGNLIPDNAIGIEGNPVVFFGINYKSLANLPLKLNCAAANTADVRITQVANPSYISLTPSTISLVDGTGTPNTTNITADEVSIVGGNTATWANIINNVGGGVPSLSQVLAVGQSAGNLNISSVNDLGLTSINGTAYQPFIPETLQAVVNTSNSIGNFTVPDTATIQSTNFTSNRTLVLNSNTIPTIHLIDNLNGSHTTTFDLDTLSLNGVPYNWSSIVAGGGTPALSSVLGAGNTTGGLNIDFANTGSIDNVLNINGSAYPPYPTAPYGLAGVLNISNDAVGASMTGINNIDLVNINGSAYPPSIGTPSWANTLSVDATANQSIDMGANNINNCSNINISTINTLPYLPAKFSNVFQTFGISSVGSGTTNVYGGASSVSIPVGTYQITYSVQFDGSILQSGGQYYSVKAYCWLQGATSGQVYPYKVNSNLYASTLISYNSGYPTCITTTDYIQILTADSFQLGVYQENELGQSANNCFISAIMIAV